jgi:hypothetical protein
VIAACDRCNAGKRFLTGQRYDPKLAPRSEWRCSECGGPLRGQKKGEDLTGMILDARRVPRRRQQFGGEKSEHLALMLSGEARKRGWTDLRVIYYGGLYRVYGVRPRKVLA